MLTWRLVRMLSVPQLRGHPARTLVTMLGIALGVAGYVGIGNVNESVVASFRDSLRTIAGESEIEINAAAGWLDETDVSRAAGVPGVQAAAGLIETFVPFADDSAESLYLLGLDFLGSPVWRAQFPRDAIDIPDEMAFVVQPDSIIVPRALARARRLSIGDPLPLVLPGGKRLLHVRGILDDVNAAKLFGGALGVMDLPAAALALGQEGRVTRILVTLAPEADRATVRVSLAAALGTKAEITAPEGRGEQAEKLLASLRAMLATASFLGLVIGAFIVHHTVAVAITERRRQFALANTVGIPRRALYLVCFLETMLIAGLGSAGGIVLGRVLGSVAAPLVGGVASEIWLRVAASSAALSARDVLAGMGIGLAMAAGACLLGVRSAFAMPTIEALRPSGAAIIDEHVSVWSPIAGLACIAAAGMLAFVPRGTGGSTLVALLEAAEVIPMLGVALIAPSLVLGAGWGLYRLTRESRSVPLNLAALHLPRAPVRGGSSVAMIAAAIGIAGALAILVASFQGAWVAWIEQHFAADLFVGSGGRVRLLAGPPMASTIAERVRAVPGVASVEPFRVMRLRVRDRDVFLQGISVRDRLAHGGLPMVEGSLAAVAAELEAGTAALVSDNLAYQLDIGVGDTLDVPAPGGVQRLRVAGTYIDYLGSLDLGAIVVSTTSLRERWHDDASNLLRVWLEPGADPQTARRRVLERLGTDGGYFVLTGRAFVDGIRDVLAEFFRAAWVLILFSTTIGVIGIMNTQVATVLDRGRDNATLHTIGIPRSAIAGGVLVECGVLGALGGMLGVGVGLVLGVQVVTWTLRLLTGWRIALQLPVAQLAGAFVLATIVSALAGGVPARVATRLRNRTGGAE